LKTLKSLRILVQALFFGLFLFVFIRSLNPFVPGKNPFLRYDPLIFLTHLQYWLNYGFPVLGILTLSLILGRFFCGWVCPLGSLIDMLDLIFKPLRTLLPFDSRIRSQKRLLVQYPPSWFLLGALIVTVFSSLPVLQFFHPNVWIIRIFSLSPLGIAFAGMLASFSLISRRVWCTYVCPLGALYGIIAKVSVFRLSITKCTLCSRCRACPMNAVQDKTNSILDHQCILCFDFEAECPSHGFSYGLRKTEARKAPDESRRVFLKQAGVVLSGLFFGAVFSFIRKGPAKRNTHVSLVHTAYTSLLRPPGVLDESQFVQRCLRCFQCAQSCPNNIIKIAGLQAGIDSIFTPHIEFEEFGCDYYCHMCQLVCPNEAIPLQTLPEKQKAKIGTATINKSLCVVYAHETNCLVCEEFCPVPEKAVKVTEKVKGGKGSETVLRYPVIDTALCIGCGTCQVCCPMNPKAITVRKI